MKLYHGSPTSGITVLRPGLSNHDKPYVYLTDNPILPLLYAYNPIERPGGFFPYWFYKEGSLHYDEYFPDQIRRLYHGHSGWLYSTEGDHFIQLDKMPWVYLSETDVHVAQADFIPDLYTALLEAEQAGHINLHRYEDFSEAQREVHRKIVRKSLEGHPEADYVRFLREYMPELF